MHVCVCVGVGGGGGGEGKVFHITHSLASHRERKAATMELSPRQKLDVANQIRAVPRSHPLP